MGNKMEAKCGLLAAFMEIRRVCVCVRARAREM